MNLLELPNDILSMLPQYIDNIESFTSAASSCRRLRENFLRAGPKTILQLAAASAPTFFSPHPYFLLVATARQVGDWALGNEENSRRLREAFQGGIEGLYEFCIDHPKTGLTLDDIRRLHLARFSIINPLADKIDKMAGQQWYHSDNFWGGGVSEPATLYAESDRAAFQIIIYGELFGSGMRAFLEPENENAPLPSFDLDTRLDYIKYCIPDWVCRRGYPGMEVLRVGPYAPNRKGEKLPADQIALQHILTCRRWRRMWAAAMRAMGRPDFSEENRPWVEGDDEDEEDRDRESWRHKLYRNALQTQGLEGMQLVTLPEDRIPASCREKAIQIQKQIAMLKEPPGIHIVGKRLRAPVSKALDPAQEVYVCMASYWPGTGMWPIEWDL